MAALGAGEYPNAQFSTHILDAKNDDSYHEIIISNGVKEIHSIFRSFL